MFWKEVFKRIFSAVYHRMVLQNLLCDYENHSNCYAKKWREVAQSRLRKAFVHSGN